MPIRKERLLDLLKTAQRLEELYLSQLASIESAVLALQEGRLSQSEALERILAIAASPEVLISEERLLICQEQTHWRLTHRKAERERLAAQRRRASAGSSAGGAGGLAVSTIDPELPDPSLPEPPTGRDLATQYAREWATLAPPAEDLEKLPGFDLPEPEAEP